MHRGNVSVLLGMCSAAASNWTCMSSRRRIASLQLLAWCLIQYSHLIFLLKWGWIKFWASKCVINVCIKVFRFRSCTCSGNSLKRKKVRTKTIDVTYRFRTYYTSVSGRRGFTQSCGFIFSLYWSWEKFKSLWRGFFLSPALSIILPGSQDVSVPLIKTY